MNRYLILQSRTVFYVSCSSYSWLWVKFFWVSVESRRFLILGLFEIFPLLDTCKRDKPPSQQRVDTLSFRRRSWILHFVWVLTFLFSGKTRVLRRRTIMTKHCKNVWLQKFLEKVRQKLRNKDAFRRPLVLNSKVEQKTYIPTHWLK